MKHSVALTLIAFTLLGCNKEGANSASTQVAAKVNGTEITVHQVNYYLSKAGDVPQDKVDQVRKAVLDRLIEQELFAAKAVEEKLNSAPDTQMALEMAKREVLSRAYLEHRLASAEKLEYSEVPKYFFKHPELFAERKIYGLKEVSFPVGSASPDDVKALIEDRKSLDQIADYLSKQNIKVNKGAAVRAAEQLPMDLLKQLHTVKAGEMLLYTDAKDHNVIMVVETRTMPINETQATPAIKKFLFSKHANEVRDKQLKTLKEQAKIEYVGSFAALAQTPTSTTTGTSPQANSLATQPALGEGTESSPKNTLAQTNGLIKLPPLLHEDPNAGSLPKLNMNK